MKKKIILFLTIITFIPSIVKAGILDNYNLKWTEEGFDAYAYNPILESDRTNLENAIFSTRRMNQSKIIEDSEGHIIIGNFSIKKYSRTKGLIKEIRYDEMRAIEYDNHIIVVSATYQTNNLKIEKIDKDLNVVSKKTFKDVILKNNFIENEKLILVYQDEDDEFLNSYVINLKDFSEVNKSSIYVGVWQYEQYYKSYIFDDYLDNIYYLDKEYNIVPKTQNSDGTYEIINNYLISKYDQTGKLLKELNTKNLLPSGLTNYAVPSILRHEDYYYIGVSGYKYNSSSKKYDHYGYFFQYNSNLELVNSKKIENLNTTYQYTISASIYINENGKFGNYYFKKYKIDELFNFTETTTASQYNSEFVHPQGLEVEEYEPNELVEYHFFADDILYDMSKNIEDKVCENQSSCYSDVEYRYDLHYDEKKEEGYLLVTWDVGYDINNTDYNYQYSEIYIINEDNNLDNPIIIPFIEKTDVTYHFNDYWKKCYGSKIETTDEYIIYSSTVNGQTYINVYDKNYKLVEEFYAGKTGTNVVQKIDYENGHLMIIFATYRPTVEEDGLNAEINQSNNTKNENLTMKDFGYTLERNGLGQYAYEYKIAYYERPYNVETKTDGNGKIEADHIEAEGGEKVKFIVTPKEGYVLGEVKVTDTYGNVVIFTDYTFTMPSADVLIEASFRKIPENPDTGDLLIMTCLAIITTGILLTIKNIKNIKWLKE